MKFSEYMYFYIDEKKVDLSPVTIENYKKALMKAAEVFGDSEMKEISFLDMKKYFSLILTSEKNQYNRKLLKHGTIVQYYIILHAFFENACENEEIPENPMSRLKRPRARKNEVINEPLFYDEEKIKYIIECLSKEKLMWRALMFFVIDSGCRCGEAMALKWDEIDFEKMSVNVCRNVQYTSEKGVYICSPKSGKNREIFLNEQVIAILLLWQKEQQKISITKKIDFGGFCFTKQNGSLMMPGCFNAYLKRFGEKYDLKGIHPHALRHTMASISIINGADIVSVSKKLGHSNVAVTLNVYSHATEEAQRRASDVLAKAIYV